MHKYAYSLLSISRHLISASQIKSLFSPAYLFELLSHVRICENENWAFIVPGCDTVVSVGKNFS